MSGESPQDSVRANPFASRFIRPGALPYIFPPGESADRLAVRLDEIGGRGEIRGPHGSGKSSLLAALVGALRAAGRQVESLELHDGQSRLPADFAQRLKNTTPGAIVVIDGYEQLGCWSRRRLTAVCRRWRLVLVVTCHTTAGMPLLQETRPTLELAQQIVARLTAGAPQGLAPERVERAFEAQGGDLREMLFELYDLYERRPDA